MRPCNGRHLLSRGTLRCGPGLPLLAFARSRCGCSRRVPLARAHALGHSGAASRALRGRARPYGVGQLCTYRPPKPVSRAKLGVARVPAKPRRQPGPSRRVPQHRWRSYLDGVAWKHPKGRQARRVLVRPRPCPSRVWMLVEKNVYNSYCCWATKSGKPPHPCWLAAAAVLRMAARNSQSSTCAAFWSNLLGLCS